MPHINQAKGNINADSFNPGLGMAVERVRIGYPRILGLWVSGLV
jgi:hypothetical protein